MLLFLRDLHHGDLEQAVCAYYRSGASIAALLRAVLRWKFGDAARVTSLLDFASGYGRVTRFLLDEVPSQAVCVADILPQAVEFQKRVFEVRGVVSAVEPKQLEISGRFAAVLVTSLFTHLPESRFGPWLAALLELVAPGGMLAFSTHDLALLPAEQRPATGYYFQADSEIPELGEEYGSTWVDESFVRNALASAVPAMSATRLARAVCNYQDLWVVVSESDESFAGLQPPLEPIFTLEQCQITTHELRLSGWIGFLRRTPARLEVVLDGILLDEVPLNRPRPDVEAALGPESSAAGWEVRTPLPPTADVHNSILLLRVREERGGLHPVWVGRLLGAALTAHGLREQWMQEALHRASCDIADQSQQLAALGAQFAELHARISSMEASRFWKLRNAWFWLKRAVRLTDER